METWRAELYHHGIKGMKWGIRRTPEQLGHKRPDKAERQASGTLSKVGKAAAIAGLAVIGGYAVSQIAASENGKNAIKQARNKVAYIAYKQYLSANGHKDSGIYNNKWGRNFTISEAIKYDLEDFIPGFYDHWFMRIY